MSDREVRPLRITFVFASRGIGGAERSMLRLMRQAGSRMEPSVVFVGGPNPAMQEELDGIGVSHRVVSGHFQYGELKRSFAAFSPQVAYMFGQLRTLIWARAARAAGVPCLIGAERGSATRRVNTIGRRLDKRLLDGYIANSRRAVEALQVRAGIPRHKLYVVYNGIDAEPEAVPTGDFGTHRRPLAVCIANIRPNKGQMVLLRALDSLRSEFPGVHAVLVGQDQTAGAFAREAEAAGFTSLYTPAGFVGDVRPFLRAADVCVLPSEAREGMPTSLLEAMRDGVPVVASDVGGVAELVRDGETGLLVRPGDAFDLAEKLGRVWRDRELAARLSAFAQQHVRNHHSLEAMVMNHLQVFREILEKIGHTSRAVAAGVAPVRNG